MSFLYKIGAAAVSAPDSEGVVVKIEVQQEKPMAAYVIAHLEVIDSEAYAEYRERLPGMLEAFGGKRLGRGDIVEVIGGETPSGRHRIILMEFQSLEEARGWHTAPQNSPDYAELRALRNRATNAVLTIISGD